MKAFYTFLFALISAMVSAQPGTFDTTFNQGGVGLFGNTASAHAVVYKSRIYKSGPHKDKIIIVGRFTKYNGVSRKYVARLNPDGTLDTTFTSPNFSNGYLYVVEILEDGNILVGGEFEVDGYRGLVRLKDNGEVDSSFMPSTLNKGTSGKVHALHVTTDGSIVVGGDFTSFSSLVGRITRLKPNGDNDLTFQHLTSFNKEVRAIVSQGDKLVVGGFFTQHGLTNKGYIARLNSDGSLDTSFNPNQAGATGGTGVFDILPLNDQFYIGGKFTHYNNVNKRGIARLNSDGSLDTTFNQGQVGVTNPETTAGNGQGYNVFAMCLQPDGKILLGGNFTQYNGENIAKGLTRIYQDGTRDITFITGSGFTGGTFVYEGASVVRDMQLQEDGRIVVGGDFTSYNTHAARMLARIKTYECTESAQFTASNGWADDQLPTTPYTYTLINDGVYTIPTGTHLTACTLEIKSGAILIVGNGASITVHGNIVNNGNFIVEDGGSLVQRGNAGEISGTGSYNFKRSTKPVTRYDYTYWSSPVVGMTAKQVSPLTLNDKYFKYDGQLGSWVNIPNGEEVMESTKGYIIRAPQNYSTTVPQVYTASFKGQPNTGDLFSETLYTNANGNWNLIGNPYPSAINADAFLTHPNNSHLSGTVYLWTHMNELAEYPGQTDNTLTYLASDYATYNILGYVAPNGYSQQNFDGKINSGQGFMVEAITSGSKAFFSNAMRTIDGNNQFFRYGYATESNDENADEEEELEIVPPTFEKHRLWLNLTNAQSAFNQTMIAYAQGATDGRDRLFDAKRLSGNFVSLYSLIEDEAFTIQGRALPFNATDIVPLGYRSDIEGDMHIAIAAFDGIFAQNDVILFDNYAGISQNLKDGPYYFSTAPGEFNDRFYVSYQPVALGVNDTVATGKTPVMWIENQSILNINWESGVQNYTVYNLMGQLIAQGKGESAQQIQVQLPVANANFWIVEVENTAGETHVVKLR